MTTLRRRMRSGLPDHSGRELPEGLRKPHGGKNYLVQSRGLEFEDVVHESWGHSFFIQVYKWAMEGRP